MLVKFELLIVYNVNTLNLALIYNRTPQIKSIVDYN